MTQLTETERQQQLATIAAERSTDPEPDFPDAAKLTEAQLQEQRAQWQLREIHRAQVEAKLMRLDETQPGGFYMGTDGRPHDADGNPVALVPRAEWTAAKAAEAEAQAIAAEAETKVFMAEARAAKARAAAATAAAAREAAEKAEETARAENAALEPGNRPPAA